MVESRLVIGSHLSFSLLESACWPHQSEIWEYAHELLPVQQELDEKSKSVVWSLNL